MPAQAPFRRTSYGDRVVDTRNSAPPAAHRRPSGSHRRGLIAGVASAAVLAAVAVVVVAVQQGTPPAAQPAGPTVTPTKPAGSAAARFGWPLLASDEFDGSAVDPATWNVYHGRTTGDVGRQSPDAVTVSDGMLQITAHGKTSGGLSWDRGQTYGRWEVRAKAQPAAGYGPVMLLWPDSGKWPQDGEIDFMEQPKPQRAQNNVTVHYGSDNSQDATQQDGDFSQWHDYALEWEPDHITGWIDGVQVFTTTNKAEIPTGPMHLAIQEDIGPIDGWIPAPDASTPATVKLDVDWVRIYNP